MEDVRYARCGKFDIIAIKNDGSVWTWGTTYESMTFENYAVSFIKKPEKILDNAVLVTGGTFHAALLMMEQYGPGDTIRLTTVE